ncbi:MAG TPA: hypothetical protein VHM69_02785 [Rubrobacter sp.]|nr:hypothetical protein [Rubrobacter sp.]
MADGILQQLPDIQPLLVRRSAAEGQLEGFLGTLASFEPGNSSSPVAPVGSVLVDLEAKLDIDTTGLSTDLSSAIDVIKNALPPGTLEYVEAIEGAYDAARDLLQDNALVKEVAAGGDLKEVALAVIEEALGLFDQRIGQLGGNLIDADTLEGIRGVFASIEEFRTDFESHSDDLLPFLTQHLLGVRPDLLSGPLQHLDETYAVLAPLAAEALNPAREDLTGSLTDLLAAVEEFDPADAAAYDELETLLGGLESAIRAMVAALTPVYGQVQTLVENHAWDDVFSTYRDLLQEVTFDPPFTVDSVTDEMAEVLEEILARFYMTFGVQDLTQRIEALSAVIHDTFAASPLGQVRQTIRAFLGDIENAIDSVPTAEIQLTVEAMLERVGDEIEALGITQIKESISAALDEAREFVTENINSGLTEGVQGAVELVLANIKSLGLDTLISELTAAVNKLDTLTAELQTAIEGYMEDLSSLLSQLDTLSFEPVGDQVIEQIDELKTRLEAIDPNTLSDVEKLALKAALALLEEIDLEDQVISGLKQGYRAAEAEIKGLLEEITAALEQLRDTIEGFDPGQVLGPVGEALDTAGAAVEKVNGQALVRPLQKQVDSLVEKLEEFSPGQVLDPLQAPYDTMMETVNRLDPAQWVAPLNDLYEQIDNVIDLIDVTPLLDELDRMQRELLSNVRTAIMDAFDAIDLPEPFAGFYTGMRPFVEDVTEAIFGDPDTALKQISTRVNTEVSLRRLAEPLDAVFDELIGMVGEIPADDLTDAMNAVRTGLGFGLEALDPDAVIRVFREGQARLVELDPRRLLAPQALPPLKLAFEAKAEAAPPGRQSDVATVSARFDAVISLVAPGVDASLIQPLIEAHDALADALRRRINALDASGAVEVYTDLRKSLDSVVPPFLRSPTPLTHDEIMAGLRGMRPSVKFDRVEEVLERFLREVSPLGEALEPAFDGIFKGIREALMFLNPIDLKDAVEDIYEAVRRKVRVLDPDALADSIRENFFDPLTGALQDINPATIKGEIDETYRETLDAVSTTVREVLDDIAEALEEQLKAMREEIQKLLNQIETTLGTTAGRVKEVIERLEELVFVELLERLKRLIDNLGLSFDKELGRVRNAFDEMLAAIPLGSSSGASGGVAA